MIDDVRQSRPQHDHPAVIVNDRPDPLLAVVAIGLDVGIPAHLDQDHAIVRHGPRTMPWPVAGCPELGIVVEDPALHEPDRLRIGNLHRTVDGLAHTLQKCRLARRRRHFNECIRSVVMIRTIQPKSALREKPGQTQ